MQISSVNGGSDNIKLSPQINAFGHIWIIYFLLMTSLQCVCDILDWKDVYIMCI